MSQDDLGSGWQTSATLTDFGGGCCPSEQVLLPRCVCPRPVRMSHASHRGYHSSSVGHVHIWDSTNACLTDSTSSRSHIIIITSIGVEFAHTSEDNLLWLSWLLLLLSNNKLAVKN